MMIMMMSKTEFKTDSIDWLNAQIEVFSKEIVVKFPRSEHSIQEYVESLKAFATDNSLVISSIVIGTAYSIITFERKRRNSKKYTAIATIAFETTILFAFCCTFAIHFLNPSSFIYCFLLRYPFTHTYPNP